MDGAAHLEPEGVRCRTTFHGQPRKDESPDDGHWIVEAAHTPLRPGDLWRLNLYRTGGVTDRLSGTWSPIAAPSRTFHAPESFGWVRFVSR